MEPSIREVTGTMKTDIEGGHVLHSQGPNCTSACEKQIQSTAGSANPRSVANPPQDSSLLSSVQMLREAAEGFLLCRT